MESDFPNFGQLLKSLFRSNLRAPLSLDDLQDPAPPPKNNLNTFKIDEIYSKYYHTCISSNFT